MDVLGRRICPKHNMEAHKMCTNTACFQQMDILVCPNCSSKHLSRQCQVIQVSLLNQKVHDLMKKKIDFQKNYHQAVQDWINQFRKFKAFKDEIMSVLNARERQLNEICRKIRRTIPYEKDKHLFKQTLGYLYLSTRSINPNYQNYQKFRNTIAETINQCNRCIHKLRLSRMQLPLFLKKQHQICSIIKQLGDIKKPSISNIKYIQPNVVQFKKQTIKFNKSNQAECIDSNILRIGDEQFITFNNRSKVIQFYNCHNISLPKTMYIGSQIQHLAVLGKNLFITNQNSNIFIFDILNEQVVKEYASSNHKNARITNLLALDRSVILNFIYNPNQIVALMYDDMNRTLKVSKGIQTKSICYSSAYLQDSFAATFQDKVLRIFQNQKLQKAYQYQLEYPAKSLAVMDQNTILASGQSNFVQIIDQRSQGLVGKFNMTMPCNQIKKIYPTTFLVNLGGCLKLFEYRMQKQLQKINLDNPAKYIQVLNSKMFISSGKQLSLFESLP